jgi:hypothetical protein
MTDEEILATANASGMALFSQGWNKKRFEFCLLAFAKQIAKLERQHEREACAEIAEKQRYAMFISLTSHPAQNGTAVGIANAIRARGEA